MRVYYNRSSRPVVVIAFMIRIYWLAGKKHV